MRPYGPRDPTSINLEPGEASRRELLGIGLRRNPYLSPRDSCQSSSKGSAHGALRMPTVTRNGGLPRRFDPGLFVASVMGSSYEPDMDPDISCVR
jgi:hypothetical protein